MEYASIDKFIGKDYSRVRIGIGKPKGNMKLLIMFYKILMKMRLLGIEKISKI